MSNWLANATGVHLSPHSAYINRDQTGNLLKNISPAAFLIPGLGPLAAAGLGGAGSALGRGMQHGANLGDILKQGASGAAIAGGGAQLTGGQGYHGALSRLQSAFAPGSGTGAGAAPSAASAGAPTGNASFGPGPGGMGWVGDAAHYGPAAQAQADAAAQGPSALSKLGGAFGHAASGVGHFAHDNPTAIGQGLQGLGNIAGASSENRLRNAQAGQLESQTSLAQQEQEAARRRADALAPFLRSLLGQMSTGGQNPFAQSNPYGP